MKLALLISFSVTVMAAQAQTNAYNSVGLTGAFGSQQNSIALDFFHNWRFGQAKKFEAGLGLRYTSYFGTDQNYLSAPASLASDADAIDTVLFEAPQVNALNIAINLGYQVLPKLRLGFNIDAVGLSFGGEKKGTYSIFNQTTGTPTSFNALLIGNNDRGTLNSEFYVRYHIKENWNVKLAYQFLFTEYTTATPIQQTPELNDRFRNKSSLISIGLSKDF